MSQILPYAPTHTVTITDVSTGVATTEPVYTVTNMEMVRALLGLPPVGDPGEPTFCGVCSLVLAEATDPARPWGYCSVACAEAESEEMEREANAVDL